MFNTRRSKRTTISLATIGLSLIVLGGIVFLSPSSGMSLLGKQETSNGTPTPADSTRSEAQPLTKVAPDSESAQDLPASATSPTQNVSGMTPSITSENDSTRKCERLVEEKTRSFTKEVEAEKKKLDGILSGINYGLGINENFVNDYNVKITSLHDRYIQEAKAEGCTFSTQKPLLDITTYVP